MKKFYVIIFMLYVFSSLQGQYYPPLLLKGNQWNVLATLESSYNPLKCGKSELLQDYRKTTEMLKLSHDTVINDKTYSILLFSPDTSGIWNIKGFLREDLDEQKVYLIPNYGNDEKLLYDFKLNVKDTFKTQNYYYYGYYIVDEESSILISNKDFSRRRIKFTNGIEWIAGIGSLNGLLAITDLIPICGPRFAKSLLCFYMNDTLLYQNPKYTECYYKEKDGEGIKIISDNDDFNVSPIPSNSFINITSQSSESFKLEIINAQGCLSLTKDNLFNTAEINITNLPEGIYFAKVSSRNKTRMFKIVKE